MVAFRNGLVTWSSDSCQESWGIGVARASESTKDMQSVFEEIGRWPVAGASGVEGRRILVGIIDPGD
jgi:hypothetical protein